ncbi:MAG TPA: NAD(P)-dependent oxidoreductase [Acidimicrobiales bacterium]|nr:NAD(P)-dependent oxidoreductase [Acidimicrobiales bacterium]
MRIFLAGATGVIGERVAPLLRDAGHDVAGMTRSPAKAETLAALGARPVVCDVFDRGRLEAEVVSFAPEILLHLLTDLPDEPSRIAELAEANNRIRTEGTANLLSAARAASCGRVLAESVAWTLTGAGEAAAAELERSVLTAGGVVLRYGQLYGPGTYHPAGAPGPPRVHVDEAARRTVEVLGAPSGVVTIVDEAGEGDPLRRS